MKLYMATDMEGASGVTQQRMTFSDQGRYQEGRRAAERNLYYIIGPRQASAGVEKSFHCIQTGIVI